MKRGVSALFVAAATTLASQSALAWGNEGHEIVALVAASELSPAVKAQVGQLLGGDVAATMADASTWADKIKRGRPETAPWHYVDIEITSSGYDAARDCADEGCVVAQAQKDAVIVGDKTLARPVRVALSARNYW